MVKKKNKKAKKAKKTKQLKVKKKAVKVARKRRSVKKTVFKEPIKRNLKKTNKAVKAKQKQKPAQIKVKGEKLLGKIAHYFDKISVAAIAVKAPLKVGDTLHIKGHTTDFTQLVTSMQINHQSVLKVEKGDDVGIKVKEFVRPNDKVFLATQEKKTVALPVKAELKQIVPPEIKAVASIGFKEPAVLSQQPISLPKKYVQTTIFEPGKDLSPPPLKPTFTRPASALSHNPKPELKKAEPKKPDPYSNMKFFNF